MQGLPLAGGSGLVCEGSRGHSGAEVWQEDPEGDPRVKKRTHRKRHSQLPGGRKAGARPHCSGTEDGETPRDAGRLRVGSHGEVYSPLHPKSHSP